MKKILLFLPVILLFACSDSGNLKIINRTGHEVYFSVDGSDYTVDGSEFPDTQPDFIEVELHTGTEFLQNVEKSYELAIQGETFAMISESQPGTVTSTDVMIKAGETTKVYCEPNFACLRITNNSSQYLSRAFYLKSSENEQQLVAGSQNLPPQESVYQRLDYASQNPQSSEEYFYYTFQVIMADSTLYDFGDENNYLFKDDLYEIIIP